MSVRVSAARDVGGFRPERGAGEEESISIPLRRVYGEDTVRYFPELVMHHDFRPHFSDSLRRARSYGRSRGREWIHDRDVPSVQPLPAVAITASAVTALLSLPLAVATLAVMPLVLYRKWISYLVANRRAEILTFPYSEALEDLSNLLGFGEGAIHGLREARATKYQARSQGLPPCR